MRLLKRRCMHVGINFGRARAVKWDELDRLGPEGLKKLAVKWDELDRPSDQKATFELQVHDGMDCRTFKASRAMRSSASLVRLSSPHQSYSTAYCSSGSWPPAERRPPSRLCKHSCVFGQVHVA